MSFQSNVDSRGRICIPAPVRRKLGIGPGSVLKWEERDGLYLVRKAGKHSSKDIHTALFVKAGATGKHPIDTRQAVADAVRKRQARD